METRRKHIHLRTEIKGWKHFRIDVEIIEDTIRLFLYIKWNPRTPRKWNEVGIPFSEITEYIWQIQEVV